MIPYELDQGAGRGRRLGLIVLSTDETLEYEARQVIDGREVNLLHARIPANAHVTPADLAAMEGEMTSTAARLPAGLNAVGYGCTSGATVIGSDRVGELIRAAHPDVPVTDPARAVRAALKHLGVTRIALVSPYVDTVSAPVRALLAQDGIEVVAEASYGMSEDWSVARISEDSTRAAMLDTGRAGGVEAIFTSCTNLRTFGLIDDVEAALGLPVVSSNLALMWHVLRLGGIEDTEGWGPGRLFRNGEHR
ncbi:maleate isomerase [Roseovarius pacificus]|uniref:Maleate isomerase n=1 Tax=Roseovarius pacificus TaxID=337701 RepID=A0A1M6XF86_9RHOB|nr:aspartate/glutamate racemase family protein [Roseovarius pacificus]GGO52204.1 Asp/Glu racemase [Roseovarius pacificus]SHL04644.1 maleate isomerase [Roseovarius pacificus]